ncbi:hypothetical protein O181_016700 [Austropuccinia psidii MF-1]|uniref:Uncharacterized protein n=1 Tax=Austropuccinia psidii MF-1 TaxID=1389203 RepID=A0A9Q3C6D8_9BASI|nr:hypothetical protein [Austropuccinia psidii MF-1]
MPHNLSSGFKCSILSNEGVELRETEHLMITMIGDNINLTEQIVTIYGEPTSPFTIKIDKDLLPRSNFTSSLLKSQNNKPLDEFEYDFLIFVHLEDCLNSFQRTKRPKTANGPTFISGVYSLNRESFQKFQFSNLSQDSIQVNIFRCCLGPPSTNIYPLRPTGTLWRNTDHLGEPRPSSHGRRASMTGRPIVWKDSAAFLKFVFNRKQRATPLSQRIVNNPSSQGLPQIANNQFELNNSSDESASFDELEEAIGLSGSHEIIQTRGLSSMWKVNPNLNRAHIRARYGSSHQFPKQTEDIENFNQNHKRLLTQINHSQDGKRADQNPTQKLKLSFPYNNFK